MVMRVGLDIMKKVTDLSLRLTVHGEFPGVPPTILSLLLNVRSSRFPHSLNSTPTVHMYTNTTTHIHKGISWECFFLQIYTQHHKRLSISDLPCGITMGGSSPAAQKRT